jgi:hypothetical protein
MNKPMGVHRSVVLLAGLLAALLFVSADTPADEGIQFVYEFNEGHSQQYKVNFKQEMFWGSLSQSAIVDMEVTEKCTGVTEDGDFTMEIVFDKVDASIMMFDRMQETNMGEQLSGQAIGFILNKFGEADEIKALGYIESWNAMEQMLKAFVQRFYVYLPDESHAKGDKWEHTDEMDEDGMNITWQTEYEFKEMKAQKGRNCAKVKTSTELGIAGMSNQAGIDYKMDGEGDGGFELYFDAADRIVVKLKGSMEIKTDMTPLSGKGDTQESTINYEIQRELL